MTRSAETLPQMGVRVFIDESDAEKKERIVESFLSVFHRQLLDTRQEIAERPATIADALFMARQFVQCTLPHSDPGDVPIWSRTHENVSLVIQPGWDEEKNKSFGYPFGAIPRLILMYVCTEVKRTEKRRVEFGTNFSALMRNLGLSAGSGRGKRSSAARVREGMDRLFSATIDFRRHLTREVDGAKGRRNLGVSIAPNRELWWNVKQPGQGALWGSWAEVSEPIFQAIIGSPVPVFDFRALRRLKKSPLALDLYSWCTYRTYAVNRTGQPEPTSWKQLKGQFGAEYKNPKNFQLRAKAAFRKIRTVYEGLVITYQRGGFTIHPGKTAIPTIPKTTA